MLIVFVSHITMLTTIPMQLDHDKLEEWEKHVYSPDLLQRLKELRSKRSIEEINTIKNRWQTLITKAYACIDQDPTSAQAQQIFTDWMNLANEEYQGYDDLKAAKSFAYKNNQIPGSPFDQKLWDFLEKTAIHMYQNRQS